MVGERRVDQAALFYAFSLEDHVPADHLLRSIDRFVELEDLRAHLAPFYSAMGRPLDRPRTADPDAAGRLLLRHSVGASAVRRGAPEPGLSLVLPVGPGRRRAGPFDLLQEPPWPFPGQRSAASVVRYGPAPLHGRGPGRRRGLRRGRQPDQGRGEPGAERARRSRLPPEASSRAIDEYLAVLDDPAVGAATPVTPKFISSVDRPRRPPPGRGQPSSPMPPTT
jgi:hypothetical protein